MHTGQAFFFFHSCLECCDIMYSDDVTSLQDIQDVVFLDERNVVISH